MPAMGLLDRIQLSKKCSPDWQGIAASFVSNADENMVEKLLDLGNEIAVFAPHEEIRDTDFSEHQFAVISHNFEKSLKELLTFPLLKGHIFSVLLDTRCARKIKIAEILTTFLSDHYNFRGCSYQGLQLTLSEAITNAIEHGNLEMTEMKEKISSSHDYVTDYFAALEQKLADPEWGERFICIRCYQDSGRLTIQVTDQGSGFSTEEVEQKISMPQGAKTFGRGLNLMRQMMDVVRFEHGGKTLILQADLSDSSTILADVLTPQEVLDDGVILLVDDQIMNRQLAMHFLRYAGYKNIHEAVSGAEVIEKAPELLPDLILLDIVMPDLDGFEVCRLLKTNPRTSHIPVIFVSTLTDLSSRTRGYEMGAVDYINKPIERNEMLARTEVHIKNGMLMRRLHEYTERVGNELEQARQFQLDLLPDDNAIDKISEQFGLEIHTLFQATQELAGDYWTIYKIDNNRVGVLMADFTGHGVVSALNTVRLHAAMLEVEKSYDAPDILMRDLNDRLHKALQIGHFATCVAGVYEASSRQFTYCSAGAPDILHVCEKSSTMQFLDCSGLPLGLVKSEDRDFKLNVLTLDPGDTLVLYSDAVIETEHKDVGIWGEEGLKESLDGCFEENIKPFHAIKNNFFKTAELPLKDDLTLVSLQLLNKS